MRVAYLIAGAGGMYCGSCLRDNRLAATLISKGRDVVLVPLYTPIRTDEVDVSDRRIFFGGISVHLQQHSSLFRHAPAFLDRLLDSPALLRRVNRWADRSNVRDLGPLTVSVLQGEEGLLRREVDKLVSGLGEINPSLINLPNLMFVGLAARLKRTLGVPVVCTLSGEDIFLDALPEPSRGQALQLIRRGADEVDGFIAPTQYYASHATQRFGLPRERVHYVPMGINVSGFEGRAAGPPKGTFTIGYLARICPEKGLLELAGAFARLRHAGRSVRLRIAGYLRTADQPYWHRVRDYLLDCGLAGTFDYVGEVSRGEKAAFLRTLHVMSVPTVYHEAKGLYVLEALGCGVPVVQPRHGSFPELIEATGGGRLYDPTSPEALADAIAELIDDPELGERLGRRGRAAVGESFSDEVMADETWSIYQRYCATGPR